jgi:phosphatidylserine/phosphatidylglycerophosphate/cardiolipin synthase-like enzyme
VKALALALLFVASSASAARWVPVGDSRVQALDGGPALWKAITSDLRSARHTIDIESRTLRNAEVQKILLERLSRGVRVRIIAMDPRKQYRRKPDNAAAIGATLRAVAALRQAGAELIEYPVSRLATQTRELSPENHRKLIVVDGKRAILSTSDLTHNTANLDLGFRLRGAVVRRAAKLFEDDHRVARGGDEGTPALEHDGVALLDGAMTRRRLLEHIDRAEHQIVIAAYDLGDRELIRTLVDKKRAHPSLDIRVVLGPHRLTSRFAGLRITRPMNLRAHRALTRAGIDVAWGRYEGDVLGGGIVHAKAAVIDGRHVLLGSTDFNARSFGGNHELSAAIDDQPELASPLLQTLLTESAAGHRGGVHTLGDRVKATLIDAAISIASSLRWWLRRA